MAVRFTDDIAEAKAMIQQESDLPVVVIPVYNAFDDVLRCYESVFRNTPEHADILIVDDCGADRRPIDALHNVDCSLTQNVVVFQRSENGGFVRGCNNAFDICSARDVVILNSDTAVGAEWLERISAAAQSSTMIATASALTNHGTILSCPFRNSPSNPIAAGLTVDEAAARIASASQLLRPTIPTAIGHCMYIKRSALNVVGYFDEAFGSGYGEEVDFSQRAVAAGFRHVCADDVFVFHRGGSSFSEKKRSQQETNERLIAARYPKYHPSVERASTNQYSPLALALEVAHRALLGMQIGIDATCIGRDITGTGVVTLQTVLAMANVASECRITVFHRHSMPTPFAEALANAPNVDVVHVPKYPSQVPPDQVDVVYRPFQVVTLEELDWLTTVGRRVVISQLDVIAFSNPTYFESDHDWLSARDLTRLVLGSVDGVTFISETARQETLAEALLPLSTPTRVVYCGTDSDPLVEEQPKPPRLASTLVDEEFLLCLGTSFAHKNRPFAIRMLQELRARGWNGYLVFAGPPPLRGDSLNAESGLHLQDQVLRDFVLDVGATSEAEKNWLLEHASLCLYPTASEGFGLVPFEAAKAGTPVLSSRQGSLSEVLPSGLRTLESYDLQAATDAAWTLLHDEDARAENIELLTNQAASFSWEKTARETVSLLEEVCTQPRNRVAAIRAEGPEPAVARDLRDRIAISSSQRPSRRTGLTDKVVSRGSNESSVFRMLVPHGSKRQANLRRFANWMRRRGI